VGLILHVDVVKEAPGRGFGEWDCHGRIEGEGSCAELLDVGWKVNEG
jgi:hypothetical protein